MRLELSAINERLKSDPAGYVAACDELYQSRVEEAADVVTSRLNESKVVLLAGPSSSGKTTTAGRVRDALNRRGIFAHMVSLDDYYRPKRDPDFPTTRRGDPDLEAPEALDLDLLSEHLDLLDRGKEILVPHFDFRIQAQSPADFRPMRLKEHEVVIFEGIHGLNPILTARKPEATRLFVSTASSIYDDDVEVFDRVWMRVLRRIVRDFNFRASSAEETLGMWKNVRRGEKVYISPYKKCSHYAIDTTHGYEVAAFRPIAEPMLLELEKRPQPKLVDMILEGLQSFLPIDPMSLPETSLLRQEFLPRQ